MKNKPLEYGWRRAVIMIGVATFSFIGASALLLTVYAETEPQKNVADDPITLTNKKSGTVHSPGSRVSLRLTFDTGAVFTVTQFEGAPIRIERNGSTISMVPHVDTINGNQVRVDIFKGLSMSPKDVSIKNRIPDISAFEVGIEPSALPISDLGSRVEIAVVGIAYEVRVPSEDKEISRFRPLFDPPGRIDECCLRCSEITVCGCAVEGACGSCCSGSCCT